MNANRNDNSLLEIATAASQRRAITYVILAHREPDDVLRLARVILDDVPSSRVVIHYSALSGSFPKVADDRIVLVEKPAEVSWGTFSQTDMMLRSLEQIRLSSLPDAWVVMLSGQSYPFRPLDELEGMLASCDADAYLWHTKIEESDHTLRERFLYRYRQVRNGPLPFPFNLRFVRGIVNRVQMAMRVKSTPRTSFIGFRARRTIFDMVPNVYHATQWIALSRKAADHLRTMLTLRPELLDAYRHAIFSEESFFATALASDPEIEIFNDDLHFTDWSSIRSGSPKSLTIGDLAKIEQSGKFFARKIALGTDDGLRDALDGLRAHRRNARGASMLTGMTSAAGGL